MTAPLQIGRYELVHPIASGGMATVYLARSRGARGFERQVALKVMHPHLAEDPEFVTMFLDEARMAANIRHPNVVPTLDVVEEAGQLFLVMEYVEGHSLQALDRSMKKRRVPMPLDVALRIALDMLAGLHAAHELAMPDGSSMNLVHRDVSPHNVLVGVDGSARIMDFGIARAEIRINSTMGTSPKGKIPYMSPEQILSSGVDRRTDVYAAGIVLWEMLAGTGLFRADNEGALLHTVVGGTKRSPAEVRPELPAPICAVCMRALAVSPSERYDTAAAFGEALEKAAAEANVMIASPRVVSALVKDVPVEKARSLGMGSSPGGPGGSDPMRSSMSSVELSSSAPVVTPLTPLEVADTPPAAIDPSGVLTALRPSLPAAVSVGPSNTQSALAVEDPSRKKVTRAVVVAIAASTVVAGSLWLFVGGAASTKSEGSPVVAASGDGAATSVRGAAPSASAMAAVAPSTSVSAVSTSPTSAAPVLSNSSSVASVASAPQSGSRPPGAALGAKASPPQGAPAKKPPSSTFRPEEP